MRAVCGRGGPEKLGSAWSGGEREHHALLSSDENGFSVSVLVVCGFGGREAGLRLDLLGAGCWVLELELGATGPVVQGAL